MDGFLLLGAHAVGDFILQNHWMQRKQLSSFVCFVHVVAYSAPFWLLVRLGELPFGVFGIIMLEHYIQDRYQVHKYWMAVWGHSPPDLWPSGAFLVDQAFHVGFLALVCLLYK